MEKLDPKVHGRSLDIVEENVGKLKELFPEVFTEGRIDFEALRETLGDYLETRQERYSFTWNGKSRARQLAQRPTAGTLRPVPAESVNWDSTQNLVIEGDNLEVLKLLQKSYHHKVKVIFIDPPYNTGNDFIYPDSFTDTIANYKALTGQVDNSGHSLGTNPETSGRYHTNWLNMIYPRLKLARNLLSDDGAIFITVDDNEVANLRKLCDEIYGEENFVATVAWKHTQQSKNDELYFSRHYNSLVIYRKSAELQPFRFPRTDEDNRNYSNPDNDPRGAWRSGDVRSPNPRPTLRYDITTPSGHQIAPPQNGWRWSKEEVARKIASGEIIFSADETRIIRKIYLSNQEGRTPENLWADERFGTTRQANAEIKELFADKAVFDTPKPTALVQQICQLFYKDKEYYVLDFFAGSGTTAQAVLDLNSTDGGTRKFVVIQLPEPCPPESEAAKAGYATIADITKERIRRAIKALDSASDQQRQGVDRGFKVFKLDSTNITPWDGTGEEFDHSFLQALDRIKAGRSADDVLYELIIKFGLDLAIPIETRHVGGQIIHIVGGGALVVCLSEEVTLAVAQGIAALKEELSPAIMRVVFLDAGFASDVVKTNALQILKQAGIKDEDVRSL